MFMYQANVTGNSSASYLSATGKIDYGMTNDYMFRVILQTCNDVLRSLICALLHMESEQIRSVVITNPIVLGQAIDDKEFVMDINIYKLLNIKDYYLFSDELTLGVVDLTCIEPATEEDKAYEIDYWARLFKAITIVSSDL